MRHLNRRHFSGLAPLSSGLGGRAYVHAIALSLILMFAPASALAINFTGNVGIGTANPQSRLHVKGSEILQAASGAATSIDYRDANSVNLYLVRTTPDPGSIYGSFEIVQISTSTGAEINRTRYSRGDSNWSFPANVCASNVTCSSDARLKQHVQSLGYGLAEVMQLDPVTFTYTDDAVASGYAQSTTTSHIGFLAQQVKGVIPEAVYENEGPNGYYGVQYELLTSVLTKALQDLNLKIDDLATTTEPAADTFAGRVVSSLFARITTWLADAANGIGDIVTKRLRASDAICINDQCLTETDVGALRGSLAAQSAIQRPEEGVGSPERPAGFTMYDMKDGRAHCIYLYGGNLVSIPGTCGEADARVFPR